MFNVVKSVGIATDCKIFALIFLVYKLQAQRVNAVKFNMINVVYSVRNSAVRLVDGSYIKHMGFLGLLYLFIFSMDWENRLSSFVRNIKYFWLVHFNFYFLKIFFNPVIKANFLERNFMANIRRNSVLQK